MMFKVARNRMVKASVFSSYTATALNNFQGTDSLEVGSREPVRVALETGGPTGGFTGPEGPLPW